MGRKGAQHTRLVCALCAIGILASVAEAQPQTVGLFQNDEGASAGYTLFKRAKYGDAYLIDNNGSLVHSWALDDGLVVYLLENGNLLVGTRRIVEYEWDGTIVWDYYYQTAHHDLARLPNGNTLLITNEIIPAADAIAAGRDPALLSDNVLRPLHIVEVQKTGPTTGTIVWEWYAWDHLVQDFDPGKPNYGVVADHPELIDLNFAANGSADWLHANGIDYNPDLDQIIVSLRNVNELWVIDHSTTIAEAASHAGGNSGKGGDLLYRWGNPRAYDRGNSGDQQLFYQHDTTWIDPGLPGAGNILMFNNGPFRPAGGYSSVDEIVPPVDGYDYSLGADPGAVYEPAVPLWIYTADPPTSLYSSFYSSAQRLPNGNTLVGSGRDGTCFEVTPDNQTVWKYVSPAISSRLLTQGDAIPFNPEGSGLDNQIFKCRRYAPDYPGLAGRDLTPTGAIELYDATASLTLQSTAGGAVTHPGEGTYSYGVDQLVTIDAQSDSCYLFAGWSVESGSANIAGFGSEHATFTLESLDTTLQANFVRDPRCDAACALLVGGSGPPDTDFATILDALNATAGDPLEPVVEDGCVLVVEPGTYSDPLLLDRFVTMVALNGDPENTIIDVDGAAIAIDAPDRGTPGEVQIRGFTIRNATDTIASYVDLVLEDCVIEPNAGTAVHVGSGSHRLDNVSISGGSSGLVLEQFGSAQIERSRVSGVSGTALELSGAAILTNNLIVDNSAPATGVLVNPSGELQMLYTTVANNGTGLNALTASIQVEHSIICGNTTDISGVPCSAIGFSDVCDTDCSASGGLDCTGAEGNISDDPLFVSPGTGDYRLPFSSPAVDAGMAPECFTGMPCRDLEDKPRLLDADGDGSARSDMGAYELDYPSALIPEPGDVPNLAISSVPGGHELIWGSEPSSGEYHIYEATLSNLGVDYDLDCLATVTGSPFLLPATIPPLGEALIYTVSGDDAAQEGTIGFGTCSERSNTVDPCP